MKRIDGVRSRCLHRGDLRPGRRGQTGPSAAGRSAAGHHQRRVRGVPAWALRISRRSKRQKRASARRSTARAALSATACRRLAAPAWSPRSGRRAATNAASSWSSCPTSGFAVPDLLDSHAHMSADHPSRGERDLAARADPVVWRGPRRSDSRRSAAGARRSAAIATATAISGTSGCHHRYRHRPTPRRTVRMESPARDVAGVRGRRLPERDGDHERPVSDELAFGITLEQMKLCDRIPDPEDQPDRRTRRRGHRQFRVVHEIPRAGRAGVPIDDTVRAGEALFGAVGCASCHVPSLQTGPDANALFHHKVVPLFSDLLLHDIGTGDGIRQEAADAAGVQDAGPVGPATSAAVAA